MHKFASKIMAVKGVQNRLHSLHAENDARQAHS